MDFEDFAFRIATSQQIKLFELLKSEKMSQSRFTTAGGEMEQTATLKSRFSQINDKRFYNINGVTSLPIGDPFLQDVTLYKESKCEKIEKYFLDEERKLKIPGIEAFSKNQRLDIYNQILTKNFEHRDLKGNKEFSQGRIICSTQSFLLECQWK